MHRSRAAAVASGALLLIYIGLSFVNHPGGSLGTDTGAKVLTLRAMDQSGTFDPDVGYWAESWDPEGRVHPLHDVAHIGDRWVIVTTLPMLLAASPLYGIGGYRLAILLPMLGGVAAALAARVLARRLGASERVGWAAFWLMGLASPVALYALDFWEHAPGLAAMAWAVILLLDGGWRRALAAGALFGLAATMRTEALAYGAVAVVVVVGAVLVIDRRLRHALEAGVAAAVGTAALLALNTGLEQLVIGTSLRGGRATATAATALGTGASSRFEEAGQTGLSFGAAGLGATLIGGILVLLSGYVARRRGGPAGIAAGGIGALYLFRFVDGLGFVPGLVPATPLAAIGLAGVQRRDRKIVTTAVVALAALPVVWVFQYAGGAGPQWGGRYILLSGFLLAVIGITRLEQLGRAARAVGVLAPVAVTVFGLVWMSVRTHDVAAASRRLDRRSEAVLISTEPFFVREGGAYYGTAADRRWLTAGTAEELAHAARVLGEAGAPTAGVVEIEREGMGSPPALTGYVRTGSESMRFFSDTRLRITGYRAS